MSGKSPKRAAPKKTAKKNAPKKRTQPESFRGREMMAALTVKDIAASVAWYTEGMGFVVSENHMKDGKLLGVRPEHLEPCSASEAMLTIDVDLIEPLGADIIVYGHIGDKESARVAARLAADAKAVAGKLAVRYAPQNVHWFDPTSGKRIES